jgi:hypothetical protein
LTELPYAAPDQRVMLWSKWVNTDKTWVSSQEVFDYRELTKTLTGVAFWANTSQNLTDAGEPARLTVGLTSANTFDVLGARPLVGRALAVDDESLTGPPVAILSYGLWEGRFNGDSNIIGQRIVLNGVPVEVIGVMPEGFRLLYAAAVLAPGQTPATATAELQAITRRLTEQGEYHAEMQFTAFAVVLAYVVSQRTQEIGIRLAIGADRSQVLGMVLRQGLSLAAIGIVAGLIGAFLVTRVMESLLYNVRSNDPFTFSVVAVAVFAIALAASLLPARRATRVSPTAALRAE